VIKRYASCEASFGGFQMPPAWREEHHFSGGKKQKGCLTFCEAALFYVW
jgi:hypothetical protein